MNYGEVNIYTDGSYMSSIESGGWGIYVEFAGGDSVVPAGGWGGSHHKIEENPTNQRMEMHGVIQALIYYKILKKEMKNEEIEITCNICTDSAYIYNCYKEGWYKKWKNNGWLNSKGKTVANKDLWELIVPSFERDDICYMKVTGHNGVEGNEKADLLATSAAKEKRLITLKELENEDNSN